MLKWDPSNSHDAAQAGFTGPCIIDAYKLDGTRLWRINMGKNIRAGAHDTQFMVYDFDGDGCDEIIYGSLVVDHDGKAMYSTQLGHGDSQHVTDAIPSRPGLEIYSCHEDNTVAYSYELRDARTGEIIIGGPQTGFDNGRACLADIDPEYEGMEGWSAAGILTAADGTVISNKYTMAANFLNWWDGDLGREIQDGIYIQKWVPEEEKTETIFTAKDCTSINGTKSTPSLTADLFGDWREETIYPLQW